MVFTEYEVPIDPSIGAETEYPTNDGSDWSLGTPSMLNGNHGVHDAQADFNGNIWFSNSVASKIITVGRVDAKTGEVRYLKVPGRRDNAAVGHAIVRDANGIMWFNLIGAGPSGQAIARLDPVTEKIDVFPAPKTMNGTSVDVDGKGKIWMTAVPGALRFDPDTKQFTQFNSVTFNTPDGNGKPYGLTGDSLGNGWWSEMAIDIVGHGDAETGKSQEAKIPPVPGFKELYSPEQLQMFGMRGSEYQNAVPGLLAHDAWVPTRPVTLSGCPTSGWQSSQDRHPYAEDDDCTASRSRYGTAHQAQVDSNHNAWTNLLNGDAVLKYDVKTSQWTTYPFPTLGAETRYFSIDEHSGSMQIILPYFRTRKSRA